MELRISATYRGNAVLLKCDGRLTDESRQLLDVVTEQLRKGRRAIVLDLSGVSLINSLGLATLVTAYTTVSNADGKLVIANPHQRVRDLMKVTNIQTVLEQYDSVDAALASLGSHKR